MVEVGKFCERLYGFDGSGGFPGSNGVQFLWVHLDYKAFLELSVKMKMMDSKADDTII